MTQQAANAKPSSVPFSTLLGISDDGSASARGSRISGLRSQAKPDADVPAHAGSQEKKAQGTQESTKRTESGTAQLIDATACLPIAKETIVPAEPQNGGMSAPGGSSTCESADSQNSDSVPAASSGQPFYSVARGAAMQRVSTASLAEQSAFDRADQKTIGGDNRVAITSEPATKSAQAEAEPDAVQVQNGGVESRPKDSDARVTSQMSLALESVVTGSLVLSSDANPGQIPNGVSERIKIAAASSANVGVATIKSAAKAGAVDPLSAPAGGNQASQVPQHSQTDPAQLATATTKTRDAIALPADIATPRGTAHDISSPAGSSTDVGSGLHRSEDAGALPQNQFDAVDTAGMPGVNAARVIQTMSESEMRVGMHSVEFGDISIRTAVSQQQLVAQITVDHRDLATAISSHIPLAQAKLGNDYGIHASIEVNQYGASLAGDRQNPQQQSQRQVARPSQSEGGAGKAETIRVTALPVPPLGAACRLDIRA